MESSKFGEYAVILSVLGVVMAGTALSLPWYEIKTLTGPGGSVSEVSTYYLQFTDQNGFYDNAPTGPENSIELLLWTWLVVGIVFIGSVVRNERPLGLITGFIACAIGGVAVFFLAPLFAHYYQVPHFTFTGLTSFGAYVDAGPMIGWWWGIVAFALQVGALVLRIVGIAQSEPGESGT